jgi:hypothetical protein
MSRISKILLIAWAILFFLSFFIHQFRPQRMIGELDGVSEEWVTIVIQGYTTWYDARDIIIIIMSWAAFASIFCAILLWRRDRPYRYQKLFPE